MTLLAVDRVTVNYGQLTALRDVSLRLEAGQTLFVAGPNGAGKSTLLKAIAGTVKPRHGQVTFDGARIDARSPEDIARLGVSMVPEGRDVFASLTVDENLRVGVGMRGGSRSSGARSRTGLRDIPNAARAQAESGRRAFRRPAADAGRSVAR